jgi:SAM-dependent methyltransferase
VRKIQPDKHLRHKINQSTHLSSINIEVVKLHYDAISKEFHSLLDINKESQEANAQFHKQRYLELVSREWKGKVLDIGNDKPFLSFLLRQLHPQATFTTISFEIPQTPYELFEVDIEKERFPFEDKTFDQIIFTEVIEHLWRNPSHCMAEINPVTALGGKLFLTTPNACDMHSIVCILWQANPNQRSAYYASLESGHIHLWTVTDIERILDAHGFTKHSTTTSNLYGHSNSSDIIEEFVCKISPHRHLMNEAIVANATKESDATIPAFPQEIFPDGVPVQASGAILSFLDR